jgi:putative spermidine/putrescine transport system ATP-binding protein
MVGGVDVRQARPANDDGPPGARGATVVIAHLSKHFGSVVAVDDLNLSIDSGEFITLLGPSGSGKSTTLMMIAGFDDPDQGEIYIGPQSVVRIPPHRREIGMVFQNYALFPHMTVAENVTFSLKQRRIAKSEMSARLAETLEIVRLRGYETRFPRQLSGGQQQRVALARAIIFRPRVLLMDEPLSALDKQLREELQFEVKRLHRQLGITFIYVTHDQREALIMSDRIAVMKEGRLEQLGTPIDLYDRPATRFVATFIGESNLLEGPVTAIDADRITVNIGGVAVSAVVSGKHELGARATLAVRPEKIVIRESAAPSPAVDINILPAQIRDVTFVGEMNRYVLELAPGTTIVTKQEHRYGVPTRAPGERVVAEWHLQDTLLI